ncbi:hypothetical protein D3C71_2154540 [compost metagenome]
MLWSAKIFEYAFVVNPAGKRYTLLAMTYASELNDLATTWMNGSRQIREARISTR